MSRLDSFVRRLEAQRACLDWAVSAVQALSGAVVELGLGNGRTYDHLRSRLAGSRTIYALDRQLAAHPGCVPEGDRLVIGDFADTLPALTRRLGASVALVHADTGSGDEVANQAQARGLPPLIDPLLIAGAVVISDQELASSVARGWVAQPLPASIEPGRYFLYRKP